MVTSTRRGPVDSTPRSTPRRSKRNAIDATPSDIDTPTISKKRRTAKKSALSTAETSAPATETEVEDTSATVTQEEPEQEMPTPRRDGSPKVVVPVSSPVKEISLESEIQDSIVHTPSPPREAGYVMSSIARHQHASPTPAKPKPVASKKGKKSRLSEVQEDTNTEEETKTSEPAKAAATKIRFGSEEPMDVDAPLETAPIVPSKPAAPAYEDEDDSDSDAAPEEVTTSAAISKAKAAEAEATRAYQAQQQKLEQKRRERLQRVADEQRAKREKDEKKAAKLAKQAAAAVPEKAPFDFSTSSLPALLPTSLLEAAGDKRPLTPPPMVSGPSEAERRKEQLVRHIRFLERGERPIKDVKKGKLNVHVLEQELKTLAPKVNRDVRNVREKWLKGRENDRKFKKGKLVMKRAKMERRPVGGGFLRGED